MSEVDDRVVAMKFDNAGFEQKMSQTLGSLDKLQKSLDFANSKRGLQDLDEAGKKFNLQGIGDAVEGVSGKFLALATVGITAISNITNRAVDAGIRIGKALTIDPAKAGFAEYELKMGSIQTILANTSKYGTKLSDVNKSLEELNTYADKTIYSFGDMTKNIGLFTNAGIKLEDATSMIKGFSNSAAASGTNAEQAAGAAYQLSQALSAGTIRLMDWRSLTNAGMGNKNMQEGLVQIAEKMGTLKKAGTTAKDVQENFNASLEDGWLSADVMSNYLKIMAGDMDEAKMKSLGLSAAQIKNFKAQQQTAEEAATKVRTFTQLVGTVKEAVGSGWAETFGLLMGNFDEATVTFTKINNAIGKFVQHSTDARNDLLKGWRKLGGREVLLQGFENALKAIGAIIKPIKEAFRQIFPPTTAAKLFELTQTFEYFAKHLIISGDTAKKIKRVFAGFFAAIEIGYQIVNNVVRTIIGLFVDLFKTFDRKASPLDFLANLGDKIVELNAKLVAGGGIFQFFVRLNQEIKRLPKTIDHVRDLIVAFFKGEGGDGGAGGVAGRFEKLRPVIDKLREAYQRLSDFLENSRLAQRFDEIRDFAEKVRSAFDRLSDIYGGVARVFGKIWDYISKWFGELGGKLKDALKPGDFDTTVDAVNVGLLGGILLILKKFLSNGLKMDFGGIGQKAAQALDALQGKLKLMQTEIKANILLKIAGAVALLTVSVVALALIDSDALMRAMIALGVGFQMMLTVMQKLDEIASGAKGAAKLGILATAMDILAGSIVILAGAVKIFATMSVDELARGLAGVAAVLAMMVATAKVMDSDTKGMIAAGIGMIGIATALTIMSAAVKLFSMMKAEEIERGLAGVAGVLGVLALAVNFMPAPQMLAAGAAMIPLAIGLNIMAGAVKLFSMMKTEDLAKGILSIGAMLIILAVGLNAMPVTLPLIAVGLLVVASAITIMAGAVKLFAMMKGGDLAKGIGAIAAMLIVLAIGVNAMSGALLGAAAIVIVAGALVVLTGVVKTLGEMDVQKLVIGLGALAAIFLVLGIAAAAMTPILPQLILLGIAMSLMGVAFALVGAGAMMLGKAFEYMAKSGEAGMKAMGKAGEIFIALIPNLITALVKSLWGSIGSILEIVPLLIRVVAAILDQLLDTIIKEVPKMAQAIGVVIDASVKLLREKAPLLIAAGFWIIEQLMQGLSDNIETLVTKAVDIVVKFAETLSANSNRLVDAAVGLLIAFLKAIEDRAADIVTGGVNLLVAFLKGISDNLDKLIGAIGDLVARFILELENNYQKIIDAGATALVKFLFGLARDIVKVEDAAVDILIHLISGLAKNMLKIANAAEDTLISFLNALAESIRVHNKDLQDAGKNIAGAILDGVSFGMSSKAGGVVDKVKGLGGSIFDGFMKAIDARSPSRKFFKGAQFIPMGIVKALDSDKSAELSAADVGQRLIDSFQATLSAIPDSLAGMDEFNPTITPVLDLTRVSAGAQGLDKMLSGASITAGMSFGRAAYLARTTKQTDAVDATAAPVTPVEMKFEQNNYSPEALSTTDIYRNTRSQIALAKEAFDIP